MIAWYGHPGWWYGHAGWWYGHPGWGPGGWIWIASMVLFWGGLLAVAVYLIRRRPAAATGGAGTGPAGTGPAEMTLAERYARGEIDAEEYRRRQAVLRERQDEGPGY